MDPVAELIVRPQRRFLKYLLAEILCACRYVLSSITFIALKSVLILCSTIVSFNCFWALNGVELVSHNTIRNSQRESRLAYVEQRFVGPNCVPNVGLLDNLRTYLPENTWSDTSLYAHKTSLITSYRNASCYTHRVYFSGTEISTRLINNQTHGTKKKSILNIEALYDTGNN